MKIYLASRFSRQQELRGYAEQLRAAGHEVTSRWLDPTDEARYEELTPEGAMRCAQHDHEDVARADLVVSFTEEPGKPSGTRGGRHVEFGIAIGLDKSLYAVGPREHVFHHLPQIAWFETWEQCLKQIGVQQVAVEP